jgi:hypothetical protein
VEFPPDSGDAVPSESGETMSTRPRRNHIPAFRRLRPSRARFNTDQGSHFTGAPFTGVQLGMAKRSPTTTSTLEV